MSTANLLFKSSAARTIFTIINTVIGFFMFPFVVGKLGDKWYGVLAIVGSLVGYYYLVDLGLSTAVQRFFAAHIARKEIREANEVINTSLFIYCLMSGAICVLTLGIILLMGHFVRDPVELHVARIVVLFMGCNLAIEFPYKALSGIVVAYLRYDLLEVSRFGVGLLNTGLSILVLKAGYGIIALVVIAFTTSQISNIFYYGWARYLFKELRFGRQYLKRNRVRELFSYSMWSFMVQMGDNLRLNLDSAIIGWSIRASMVTHYSVGKGLAGYFSTLVARATNILTPVFTKYHAEGNYEEIRSKLLFMSRINAIVSIFGGGWIILVGRSFIARWMGTNYLDAYPVLIAIVVAATAEIIQYPGNNVLYAISKHRFLAWVTLVEGIVNASLCLILVRYLGIVGVALGIAIPLVVSRVIVLPNYVCRNIGLPIGSYYKNLAKTAGYTVGYLALFYVFTRSLLAIPEYKYIFILSVSVVPLYALSILFVLFSRTERSMLWSMFGLKLGARA